MPAELFPEILLSGSSDAGLAAAEAIGATPVKCAKAPGEEHAREEGSARGSASAGETWHAVTLHWMDAGIDTGPVAYSASFRSTMRRRPSR